MMKEYIDRESAIFEFETNGSNFVYGQKACNAIISRLKTIPAADVVPWEWLERYADCFFAEVSMPEFVREAKMVFYKTMQGGVIDG